MKKSLTRAEMLTLWRNFRMAEPLRLDCAVERVDGTDLTEFLEAEMRGWYLDMLDRGELGYLCPTNVAPTAVMSGSGLRCIELTPSARRVVSVEFSEWGSPVGVNATEAMVRAAASNPYWRRPLVAALNGSTLIVAGAKGTLKAVNAIIDPGPDSYVFDDSALALLPKE